HMHFCLSEQENTSNMKPQPEDLITQEQVKPIIVPHYIDLEALLERAECKAQLQINVAEDLGVSCFAAQTSNTPLSKLVLSLKTM
ncbi:hypothetical protein Moror_5096, partial [Moniliophthora roreri MCA 2997]